MITTKHGNKYTNQEWAEMMAEWSKEADYSGFSDIISGGAAKLVELAGVPQEKSYGLSNRIFNFGLSDIQFSSPEKEEAVKQINKWMEIEFSKLD